jgi:hypothetical protein
VAIPAIVAGAEEPPLSVPAVEPLPFAVEPVMPDAPHPASKLAAATAQAMPRSLMGNLFNVMSEPLVWSIAAVLQRSAPLSACSDGETACQVPFLLE